MEAADASLLGFPGRRGSSPEAFCNSGCREKSSSPHASEKALKDPSPTYAYSIRWARLPASSPATAAAQSNRGRTGPAPAAESSCRLDGMGTRRRRRSSSLRHARPGKTSSSSMIAEAPNAPAYRIAASRRTSTMRFAAEKANSETGARRGGGGGGPSCGKETARAFSDARPPVREREAATLWRSPSDNSGSQSNLHAGWNYNPKITGRWLQ